jgi:EmrB/QacA subfamily drug resistance transporter
MNHPHSAEALRARLGPRYRWLLLLSVMIGTMASIMSSTVVNVAIPDMSHTFTLGQSRAQWVSSAFMLASTSSMLTTPWLLERFGYRRTFARATWLLMIGGIVGGISQVYEWVLLARVAEGLAAGVLQPIPAIIILRAFDTNEQGRASGLFGMGVVLAPAIGPSVGGLLVEAFGWRSVFLMVVPFCLASLYLARRYVPITGPGGAQAQPEATLDWRGLALVSLGALSALNGLVALHGDSVVQALGLLVLAAVLLMGFVSWQRHLLRHHGRPLLNMHLFGHRQFAMGSLVALIYGTALFGSTYLLPIYLQTALGLSPAYVGSILLPAGLILGVTIAVVGRLADRHPTWLLVVLGLILLASSFVLMLLLDLQTPLWWLVAFAILGRIGLGFILPSLNLAAMRGLDRPLIAQGSSAINFLRMFGGAAGVSLCGIVLEWRLAVHGESLSATAPSAARLSAFNDTFLLMAVVCSVAVLAAWRLRDRGASAGE